MAAALDSWVVLMLSREQSTGLHDALSRYLAARCRMECNQVDSSQQSLVKDECDARGCIFSDDQVAAQWRKSALSVEHR